MRDLLALIAYQHPVMLELDDAMTALRAVVEPLLDSGKARVQGSETLVVSRPGPSPVTQLTRSCGRSEA